MPGGVGGILISLFISTKLASGVPSRGLDYIGEKGKMLPVN